MLKRIARTGIGAAVFMTLFQHGLLAQLKFTLHTDLNRVDAAAPSDWSALVSQLAGQVIPAGGVDHVVLVSDKAMLMEQKQPFAGMAGGVLTLFREGQQFGIDPASKTFWKIRPFTDSELQATAASKPDVKVTRTGEVQTINGMRAERVTTVITLKMPRDAAGTTFPGFPTEPAMTFDVWVTDAVKVPAGWVPLIDQKVLAQLGIAHVQDFTDKKLLVRAVVKLNLIPDFEIVMTVRDLTTEPVPDSVFEIPAGYKEIPPPANRGGN
ncbi:MAG TPA: hypothetical protein VES67_08595 [Vicinamibacterales bacterium]|nr:hypothetical protein [Vicinamibacterales bacterium]